MSIERKTAANVKQAVPFFHVSNIKESLRFYVEGLGFAMTKKWTDEGKLRWCCLEIGDAALMLQEFRKEGHDSWKPSCKVGEAYPSASCAKTPWRSIVRRHLEELK